MAQTDWDPLKDLVGIQERMNKWCVNAKYAEIPLVAAHYGENSGIAGGAALCCARGL